MGGALSQGLDRAQDIGPSSWSSPNLRAEFKALGEEESDHAGRCASDGESEEDFRLRGGAKPQISESRSAGAGRLRASRAR